MRGLAARGLSVALGEVVVLDGLDLDLPRGVITALLAPSGAGKSTLLRALVGLVELRAGRIALDGVDVASIDARVLRRRVGLVAQAPVMLEGTVADNCRHANEGLDDDGLRRALEAAGLGPGFAPRVARELSGGERARVALARALARDPELLLLDEPTAALDEAAAATVGATLRRLRDEGHGIALTTHDERFAARWADRLVRLP